MVRKRHKRRTPSVQPVPTGSVGTAVEIKRYSGGSTDFPYAVLSKLVDEPALASYCSRLRERFREIASRPESEEEWIVRCHASIKMLMAGTVLLCALRYASRKQLKIVIPYLTYYSLFQCSRALLFMLPDEEWRDGGLLKVQHQKVVASPARRLRTLSGYLGDRHHRLMKNLKAIREFFSYSFPGEGFNDHLRSMVPEPDELVPHCVAIAEVCQLHSECLEAEFPASPKPRRNVRSKVARAFYIHAIDDLKVTDNEDSYRLDYAFRKISKPANLWCTVTEGMVEDFFGAWEAEDGSEFELSPEDWNLIFPMYGGGNPVDVV